MTIEEMKQKKRELGYSNSTLAFKAGIPVGTLQKIFSGETKAPRQETIRKLESVLAEKYVYKMKDTDISMVREAQAAAYSVNKGYTLDDYLNLPDDQRVELIDGIFYDMSAPSWIHQAIAGYIYSKFLEYLRNQEGDCYPFISPIDVQLDKDEKTVVQPDVVIVCDPQKIWETDGKRLFGEPDLVVEVLSPSTRKKDMTLKMWKYSNAGVKEYWIVDPKNKVLYQYDLRDEELPMIPYSFDDIVPVLLFNGRCKVDLHEMYESVKFLMK